jgi:hypothetical protein
MLLGAYDGGIPATLEGIESLEQSLGTTLPLIQIYTAWGDKPDQQFPQILARAITDMGSIPLITWEPWLSDFESGRHPEIALRDVRERHGMGSVARGITTSISTPGPARRRGSAARSWCGSATK